MKALATLRRDPAMLTLIATLAALGLVIIMAWLWLWGIHHANRQAIEDLEPRVARQLGLQQAAEPLAEQARQTEALLRQLSVPASLPANQAATELMQRLRQTVEKVGMVMQGSQTLPVVERGEHQIIPVSITVQGSVAALADLLASLRQERPLIRIERLAIQPQRDRRKDTAPGQILRVEMKASIARASE